MSKDESTPGGRPEIELIKHLRDYHNVLRSKSSEYAEDASNSTQANHAYFKGKAEAYGYAAKKLNNIFTWLNIKP
jgi:hypothetical protein